METKISSFRLIKLIREKVECIRELMDFLIVRPSTGKTTHLATGRVGPPLASTQGRGGLKLSCSVPHGIKSRLEHVFSAIS